MQIDEKDKERIVSLTIHIVEGMIERGEVDPTDDEALKKAGREAVEMAKTVYFAALAYVIK